MSEDTATVEEQKESVVLPEKLDKIAQEIESLSVLEVAELVKGLEDRLGIQAAAPMVAGAVVAGAPAAGGAEAAEEKTEFDVVLKEVGGNKIAVIKEVRAATSLGLKEAKDLVESAPKPIKEGVSKEEAEELKGKLEAAGAKAEVA